MAPSKTGRPVCDGINARAKPRGSRCRKKKQYVDRKSRGARRLKTGGATGLHQYDARANRRRYVDGDGCDAARQVSKIVPLLKVGKSGLHDVDAQENFGQKMTVTACLPLLVELFLSEHTSFANPRL